MRSYHRIQRGDWRSWLPALVLAGSIAITGLAARYVSLAARSKDRLLFQNAIQEATENLENRIETYIALLRAASGFLTVRDGVTRDEFQTFVAGLQLKEQYPGTHGMGFAVRVRSQDVQDLVASMRRQHTEDFRIWPDSDSAERFPVIYREPLDSRSRSAIGYDPSTEPIRRSAMERARDTGHAAASGRIILVQESKGDSQAGFIVYLPVYHNGPHAASERERRESILGFVYAPFRADDLLNGVLGNQLGHAIDVQAFDGAPAPENILHNFARVDLMGAGRHPKFEANSTVEIAGRTWTLRFVTAPEFGRDTGAGLVPFILIGGTAIGLLLFWILRSKVQALAAAERIAAELRVSEERFRDLFENANDVVYTIDLSGKMQSVNRAAETISGYTREQLLGMSAGELISPESLKMMPRMVRAKFEGQGVTNYEIEMVKKDGGRATLEISSRLIYRDGKAAGVQGIGRDITERKKAEEALRNSEEKHREILLNIQEGYYETDLRGRIQFFSAPLSKVLGVPEDKLLGLDGADYCGPDEYKKLFGAFNQVFKTGAPLTGLEYEVRTKDGQSRFLEVSASLIREASGRPSGFRGLIHDVTERKRAEEQIKDSEQRYRILFESNPQPMWVFDFETLAFLAVNTAAIKHYGYSLEEFLSMTIKDIRSEDEVSALLSRVSSIANVENSTRIWQHRRKDGSFIDVEVTSHSLDFGGRKARLTLLLDITERKRLEAQLLQAQKMQAVGRLAGGIAHDFNNLLTAIIGYSQILAKKLRDDPPLRTSVEEIEKAGMRAAELTRQLLAFSRKQMLQPKILDLNSVVTELGRMLKRLIGEDIELVTVLKPDLGCVEADPGQVQQVIMNLAVNARDAMPQGGRLIIETTTVQLDQVQASQFEDLKPGPHVVLTVRDTGSGMEKTVLSRVFEPFFTTKEQGKGTGLGLSTVYGIVKQSGGHVSASSEPGHGTTFEVYLPLVADGGPQSVATAHGAEPPRGTETILLVEDEEIVRRLTRLVLESSGYRVLEAENGPDALRLCQEFDQPVQLMITDVVMPQMSGNELVQRIRLLIPKLKVLYISGYTDKAIGQEGRLDFRTHFLQKPFDPADLVQRVRQILDQESE
jgi:two-component system cell cycle sensor histidine kinase/response regulator CckA